MFTDDTNMPSIPRRQQPGWWLPLPGTLRDRQQARRLLILIIVIVCAGGLIWTGRSLETVLITVLGVGFAGTVVARWVVDGAPLPFPASVLPPAPEGGIA